MKTEDESDLSSAVKWQHKVQYIGDLPAAHFKTFRYHQLQWISHCLVQYIGDLPPAHFKTFRYQLLQWITHYLAKAVKAKNKAKELLDITNADFQMTMLKCMTLASPMD